MVSEDKRWADERVDRVPQAGGKLTRIGHVEQTLQPPLVLRASGDLVPDSVETVLHPILDRAQEFLDSTFSSGEVRLEKVHSLVRGEGGEVERRFGQVFARGDGKNIARDEIALDDDDLGPFGGLQGRSTVRLQQVRPQTLLLLALVVIGGSGMTLTGEPKVVGQDHMSLFPRQGGYLMIMIMLVLTLGRRVKVDRHGLLFLMLMLFLIGVHAEDRRRQRGRDGEERGEPHPSSVFAVVGAAIGCLSPLCYG